MIVTDTGPLNYLLLSGYVHLLPELYQVVLLPTAVLNELQHPKAPQGVRDWVRSIPHWAIVSVPEDNSRFRELGLGEREAIALALEKRVEFLLMDETEGRKIAVQNGIHVKGTLGVLEEASGKGIIDFADAISHLRATGIFLAESLINEVLSRHRSSI
jgi:predicted nucleic acid-binding protein